MEPPADTRARLNPPARMTRCLAHPFCLCILAIALPALASCAAEGSLPGGDFEGKNPLSAWTVKSDQAEVDVNRIGSDWIPITVTFNSGPYDQALLIIGAYSTPGGRCWIDNVRPQGFELVNASFEDEVSFLPLPDEAPKRNWRILPPPKPGGWFKDFNATHHVSDRASHGKRSAMLSDPAMATQMIRIWQVVRVTPHTDYQYSFDFFMSEDFSGSLGALAMNVEFDLPGKYHPMGAARTVNGVEGLTVSDLVADRAAAGYQQCQLSLAGGRAELSRTVDAPAQMHLEAGVLVKTKGLDGAVTLAVLDAKSDETLAETSIKDTQVLWQPVRLPFVSVSDRLTFRLAASGKGKALVDGAYLSHPRLRPSAQSVEWLSAIHDFVMSSATTCAVEGESGDILETGLEMLRKDLGEMGVKLKDAPQMTASIVIRIGQDAPSVPADKGPEAYHLEVTHDGVRIDASTDKGAFYGIMTLLQLLSTSGHGAPVAIACRITDWPDLPWRALNRGAPGLTPEWMARRKLNVAFHITEKDIPDWRRHAIRAIPHKNITHYPYNNPNVPDVLRNPNYAEGMGRTDKLILTGEEPAELSGRNVLRTKLTDIAVTSADGKAGYTEGRDYRVIPGELKMPRRSPTSFEQDGRPFMIARVPGSRIADRQTVLVRYEHVAPGCGELCLAELEPQQVVAQRARQLVEAHDLPFIGLHVSESPRGVGKGPRCQATGLTPSQLMARYYRMLDEAIKKANPDCRIITHSDDFLPWQHTARSGMADAAGLLPKDAILSNWHYGASDSVAYAYKTARLWTELGHEFFFVPMYDYWNIHVFAAAALWARTNDMPCIGLSDWAYHLGPYKSLKTPAPFIEEVAACAWRVPRRGEKGYVDFEAELEKIGIDLTP